jgi:hypothetical protein
MIIKHNNFTKGMKATLRGIAKKAARVRRFLYVEET